MASLNQSLGRMGLGYVDIFYHHRPPNTPLAETMGALDGIVRPASLVLGIFAASQQHTTRIPYVSATGTALSAIAASGIVSGTIPFASGSTPHNLLATLIKGAR